MKYVKYIFYQNYVPSGHSIVALSDEASERDILACGWFELDDYLDRIVEPIPYIFLNEYEEEIFRNQFCFTWYYTDERAYNNFLNCVEPSLGGTLDGKR